MKRKMSCKTSEKRTCRKSHSEEFNSGINLRYLLQGKKKLKEELSRFVASHKLQKRAA